MNVRRCSTGCVYGAISLLTVCLMMGRSQALGQSRDAEEATGPRMTFDRMRLELGVVSDLDPVPFEFQFANSGTETLVITEVKSSCKCTVPELEKTEYLPGERGTIQATFNPQFRKGSENKAITITSNDVEFPTLRLLVHVTVDPVVDLEQFNYDAGEVVFGTGATIDVPMQTKMKDLRVDAVEISGPNVTWEVLDPRKVMVAPKEGEPSDQAKATERASSKPREPYEALETTLRFTIDRQAPLEPFRRAVTVKLTLVDQEDREIEYEVMFGLTARIVSDLWLRPQRVAAGRLLPGQEFTQIVRLSSRKGLHFKVLSVETMNGNGRVDPGDDLAADMEVTYRQITGDGGSDSDSITFYEFTLTGRAPSKPGRFFGTVLIHTDCESDPVLTVRYSGIALEPQ